jgi:small subunit ribosomal protein S9
MHFVRPALRVSYRRIPRRSPTTALSINQTTRTLSTEKSSKPYIPPDSRGSIERIQHSLPHPKSPTFFSGRSNYLDNLYSLEKHLHKYTALLHSAHITPLPQAATHHVGNIPSYWRDLPGMYQILGKGLKETQYRRLIGVLQALNRLRHLAKLGGRDEIAESIMGVIGMYERGDKRAATESGKEGSRKRPKIDEVGRVYALGRRKTSSARVWVIPIQNDQETKPAPKGGRIPVIPVTPSQILVNSLPVSQYFTHSSDRERAFRPLKLTGLLTAYNVFCLVRGGGTRGQAEAIAMGISRALAELEPSVKGIIRQGKCFPNWLTVESWILAMVY